jgi:hypothetical protein
MTDNHNTPRRIRALALLGGGLAAGVIGASTLGANAQSVATGTGSTTASTSTSAAPSAGRGGGNGETAVTGTDAAKLKAAALAKVPGGTVEEVTTDSGDAAYEVHISKSDGSEVTVKFDKNLTYVATEDGRGK